MLTLQQISDRLEIQDLLVRYAGAIDRREFDLLEDVFTPDAHVDYGAYGGPAGPYPEIRKWLEAGLAAFPAFQHLVGNAELTITADRATGRIMCFNPMVLPLDDAFGQPVIGLNGLWYIDSYVRTTAGWRIARRSEERSFSHNFPPSHRM